MPGYIFGVENMSAKMPSSIKILHVPRKYYSFSFFCSYLFLPLENRDGWECNFFHTSADFSNCAWWVQPGRHGCSLPHLVTHNCHPWAGKHFCVRSRAADDSSDAFSKLCCAGQVVLFSSMLLDHNWQDLKKFYCNVISAFQNYWSWAQTSEPIRSHPTPAWRS